MPTVSADRNSTFIQPARPAAVTLVDDLRELWRYRSLIVTLAARQLRLRYKNSAIGLAWSLIIPLVQAFAMTVMIGYVLGSGPRNLGSFILCGYLPWTFFQSAVLDGSSSVLTYQDLLKKVYMPREVMPISTVLSNLVHFAMAFVVFLFFRYVITTAFFGWPGLPPATLLWFPVVLAILIALTLGVTFFLCAWTTFYEDVKYLVSTGLNLVLYLLPIMYFAENIFYAGRLPVRWRSLIYHVYLLNPMAWLVTAFKQMFFAPQIISSRAATHPIMSAPFDWRYCLITGVVSVALLVGGYVHFNDMKWKFTERP